MFPLFDDISKSWFGLITWFLIAINILATLILFFIPGSLFLIFWENNILVPGHINTISFLYRAIISMHLHSDYFHLIFNMIFLFAFGLSTERMLGRTKFLLLYYFSGLLGSLFYCLSGSTHPIIGASGAISGLMAAYLVMFPTARFFTMLMIFWVVRFIYVPAWIYIIYWIIIQMFGLFFIGGSNIAYSSHIGGVAFGLLFGIYYRIFIMNKMGASQ